MKLLEYVKANQGLKVKIGTEEGFYFLFIGEITDETILYLDKENDNLYKRYNRYLKNRLRAIKKLKSKEDLSEDEKQELETSNNYIEKWKDYISSWKHLLDREIVNMYGSIYRDYDVIIIIEGREASSQIGIGTELREWYE